MLYTWTKKFVFLILLSLVSYVVNAQQDHFVYLQTDNGSPFYVKMDNKILSSSSEGYIIIPNINEGVLSLKVGFPKNEYPEENFTLSVENKNEGYLIKHFDKGLQLFNFETLALISGDMDSNSNKKIAITSVKDDANPFTKMLANVVKDSTILQNHVAIAQLPDTSQSENNPDSANLVKFADSAVVLNKPDPYSSEIRDSNMANKVSLPSVSDSTKKVLTESHISRVMSMKNEYGLQMLYADSNGIKIDTIEVFMPNNMPSTTTVSEPTYLSGRQANNDNFDFGADKNVKLTTADTATFTIEPANIEPENKNQELVLKNDSVSSQKKAAEKTAPEQVFYIGPSNQDKSKVEGEERSSSEKKGLISDIKIRSSSKKENAEKEKPQAQMIVLPKVVTSSKVNSDCKNFANNEDFLKLRKKMAAGNNKEEMIKMAKKFFKSECFSTEQIKNLSYLFLTDEGKYMFFDAAYAFTSDSDQYYILASQLKDEYYINRFKAMIKK